MARWLHASRHQQQRVRHTPTGARVPTSSLHTQFWFSISSPQPGTRYVPFEEFQKLQPLDWLHAPYPILKLCIFFFIMVYGSLICLKWLQSWQTKIKRGACRPQENITVQSNKQNNPGLMWRRECPSPPACHLAVSLSWVCFHTSSERKHSGLPADMKIRAIVQAFYDHILVSTLGLPQSNIPRRCTCGPLIWSRSPLWGWMTSSFFVSCPIFHICPIWALDLIPMDQRGHL